MEKLAGSEVSPENDPIVRMARQLAQWYPETPGVVERDIVESPKDIASAPEELEAILSDIERPGDVYRAAELKVLESVNRRAERRKGLIADKLHRLHTRSVEGQIKALTPKGDRSLGAYGRSKR